MRIYVTKHQGEADHLAFLTSQEGEERGAEKLRRCSLTTQQGLADLTVYITDQRGRADIIILRRDFP